VEALQQLNSPARQCASGDDFADAIRRSLTEPPDRQRCREFAASHDWRFQASRLLEMLDMAG